MTRRLALALIMVTVVAVYALQRNKKADPVDEPVTASEINFSEKGYLSDREPDKFNQGLYLVYEKPGSPALSAKLIFDPDSVCVFGSQSTPCQALNATIETATAGKRVFVEGIKNDGDILVRNLTIDKEADRKE